MNFEISPPRVAIASIFAALCLALLAGGASAQAATCSGMPNYPSSKGGYFQTLSVTKISCKAGKSLMKSHYKCRVKKGIKRTCTSVRGYRCAEKRGLAIPTEFSAKVTCKRGTKRFVYSYQQNT